MFARLLFIASITDQNLLLLSVQYSYQIGFPISCYQRVLVLLLLSVRIRQTFLSHAPTSYLHHLFLAGTFISYWYLLYSHTSIRYSFENSLETNHFQLLVSHSSRLQRFFKTSILKNFEILKGKQLRWFLFLTLFRMGFFGAAHGLGWAKCPPP